MRISVLDSHPDDKILISKRFKNGILKGYEKLLALAFRHDILPLRTKDLYTFPRERAPLYVHNRTGNESSDVHTALHDLFWDESDTHKRIVCITGHVGCGKSTLVDYYLRSHCPNDSSKAEKFRQKLTISINCEGMGHAKQLRHKFWTRSYSAMRAAIQNHHTSIDIDSLEKQIVSPRERVEELLRRLTPDPNSKPVSTEPIIYKYIVLVIDNLDRSPLDVQQTALAAVRDWMEFESGIKLWQVYIPLWRSTRDELRKIEAILLRKEDVADVHLEPLDPVSVINTRIDELKKEIRQKEPPGIILDGHPADDVCKEVERAMGLLRLRPETIDFSSRLMGGNMRKCVDLWEGVFSSSTLSFYNRYGANSGRGLSPYELYDALIVGPYPVFNSNESNILNIFNCVKAQRDERDIFIAVHALYLLKGSYQSSFRTVGRELASLGYMDSRIDTLLSVLLSGNMFHLVPTIDDDRGILIHQMSIDAYLELMLNAAYIDNMAIVTPLEERIIKSANLRRTSGFRRRDFRDRVECTVAFLEYLREQECAFLRRVAHMETAERTRFENSLKQYEIPAISTLMAESYKTDRLHHLYQGFLRKDFLQGVDNITDIWWKGILERSVFNEKNLSSKTAVGLLNDLLGG